MYVSIHIIRKIIHGAVARGASLPALCKVVGLSPTELGNNDQLYQGVAPAAELWQRAEEATGDRLLGLHIGEEVTPMVAGLTGYLINTCPTAFQAFKSFVDFQKQVTSWVHFDLQVAGEQAVLTCRIDPTLLYLPENVLMHISLMGITAYTRLPGLLTGTTITPLRVELAHVKDGHLEECRRVMRCPVTLTEGADVIYFRKSELDRPMLSYDRSLHNMFSELLKDHAQAAKRRETFAGRVRDTLIRDFQGQSPGISVIASHMNMSGRTFQRKLEEEGKSYRAILQEVRREFAESLLKNSSYTLDHIADLLGFADASSFTVAFKQWTGVTPGSVRKAPREDILTSNE